jgi:GH24 family phage-related lysozyme (muramidase)
MHHIAGGFMTEQTSAAPVRAPSKAGGWAAAAVLAAVTVAPFTAQREGTKLHACRDSAGYWTICNGYREGVGPDTTATPEQCKAWLVAELTEHMKAALRATPALAENRPALMAAGDLGYNGGDRAYSSSPIATAFAQHRCARAARPSRGGGPPSPFRSRSPARPAASGRTARADSVSG